MPKRNSTVAKDFSKVTVVLLHRHVAYLDRVAVDIRLSRGLAVSRAKLIRGLIEALENTKLDEAPDDGAGLTAQLVARWGKKKWS